MSETGHVILAAWPRKRHFCFLDSTERLAILAKDEIVDFENGLVHIRRQHRFAIRAVAVAFDAFLDRAPPNEA
ncbi:hypothetical protein RFM68_26230 [Mesorhizobium sp. MSK_1335]|uniref:Uncharacterized protein n=1 Tax=Mesorhizobium montanum TaxID=3072323 RepID=A0ABU4ZRE7_9HYPH|nr:hypothetical protein [Mesorhizobium sp. MSK_1335]MDX8527984.1 hypothetical protein [Mesorhizobium sp. MSK_1335]